MEVLDIIKNLNGDNGEFAGLSDETISWWIEFCRPFVSKKKFGIFYERALALVAMHWMTMNGASDDSLGVGGIGDMAGLGLSAGRAGITSLSEGGSSISFGNAYNSSSGGGNYAEEYSKTTYGRQFLMLLRMVIVPITIDGV